MMSFHAWTVPTSARAWSSGARQGLEPLSRTAMGMTAAPDHHTVHHTADPQTKQSRGQEQSILSKKKPAPYKYLQGKIVTFESYNP
jgi:hypothetical protein